MSSDTNLRTEGNSNSNASKARPTSVSPALRQEPFQEADRFGNGLYETSDHSRSFIHHNIR